MIKLKCLSEYHNRPRALDFELNAIVEVDPTVATFLLSDAPGSFEVMPAAPVTREMAEPPRTTSIPRAPRSKTMTKAGD